MTVAPHTSAEYLAEVARLRGIREQFKREQQALRDTGSPTDRRTADKYDHYIKVHDEAADKHQRFADIAAERERQ